MTKTLKAASMIALAAILFVLSAGDLHAQGEDTKEGNPMVYVKTTMGNFTVELYEKEAPITVENFLGYVDKKFYEGTIFHRVINGFMIQGGGFTKEMSQKPTGAPIKNEATNGLKNKTYTLAMARTGVIDSATCQFFINVADNTPLDHKGKNQAGFGYCVFGKVIEGMDVIDKIKVVKTTTKGRYADVPVKPVIIKSISRILPEEE